MESILNVDISVFKNYNTPSNPKTVNLLTWLTSTKYKNEVDTIRLISDKKERDKIKATLPAITPSGCFTHRRQSDLVKHSGFIQFDIDPIQENLQISNWSDIKKQICNISNVAYFGLSVSGKGYWGLIPIETPENHKQHFEQIETAFKKIGITLDSAPKNVASLRGYSYDSEAHFNHAAKPLKLVEVKKIEPQRKSLQYALKSNYSPNQTKPEDVLRNLIRNAIDGEKHTVLNKASYLAGGYIAGGLINEQEAVQILLSEIQAKPNVKDLEAAKRTILKSIENGKRNPITQTDFERYLSANANYRSVVSLTPKKPLPPEPIQKQLKSNCIEPTPEPIKAPPIVEVFEHSKEQPQNWNNDIAELENYFASIDLPTHPIKLDKCSTISDCSLFIETHFATVKRNNGNKTFEPYLHRLYKLQQAMNTQYRRTG